ncbi:uncharacterized protein LOC121860243 [Homarus americanus]|uniref:uncharacterized protein LOC121860243 n=1 Tax=Homarus americanus TaxID=6706 RepID=UPI001C47989F|nr:uncharacterized protein LOC121860243 [Homarus americanus]
MPHLTSQYMCGRVYVDGQEVKEGTLVSEAALIPLNGTLYLGQDQDKFDGGLDSDQTLSGYITQVNIWNRELDPSYIESIANCLENPQGNMFSTDTTSVQESNVSSEMVHIKTFCKSREKYFIIPVKMLPIEAERFCKLTDSKFFIPEDEETNSQFANVATELFTDACAGKSYRFIILGGTDIDKEGQWRKTMGGEPLTYIPWSPGEPNGWRIDNCLVLSNYNYRWGDVGCYNKLCFSCSRTNLDYLQLRGMCQINEHQTRFLLDGYINGKPFFRGYYGLIIYHSGVKEWILHDIVGNVTLATVSMMYSTDYPIGRQRWTVNTSFCDHLIGSDVVLGLSTCTTQDFMCTDGSCVHRSVRCNLRDDCLDGSDEENCTTISFSDRYHNYRPPPGVTFRTPLQIVPVVDLIRFSKIDDINLAFNMEIEISLSWPDRNLKFKNIKSEEGKNKLNEQEVEKIWSPEVEFLNVNNGELKMLKTGVYVKQTGNPDPPLFYDVQMDTIYQPSSGQLVQRRQYYGSFNCHFKLFRYPFDTQTCIIVVKLASADTTVLELKNSSVVYSGMAELPKYEVQNIKISLKNRSGYAVIEVMFQLERRWSLLMLTIFLPTFLLLGIGYGTLFIKLAVFQARAVMTLTTLLVLYTLFNQVSSGLPDTAYIKMLDLWFFFCIFVIFSIIVIHITVEHLDKEPETPKTRTVQVSPVGDLKLPQYPSFFPIKMQAGRLMIVSRRFVYPLIITSFCLVFWVVILSVS